MRKIRLAESRDAPQVAAIYAPAIVGSAISFETEPPTAEEMESRIASVLSFAPWLVSVTRDGGAERVEGYVYASRHRDRPAYGWCVDVAIYVHQDARRAGVGRALYASLFALLRLQGFHAAHAGITLPNAASVGIHESFGFQLVGVYPRVGFKCGAWRDVGWWQLELLERTGEPRPTLSMEALLQSDRWDEAIGAGERGILSP
jgi:L-amino acid N-acyltransferase YncA